MKLSEHLVKSKTKTSEIQKLKALNVWGCQLSDITLILQMPLLEVLVLGHNEISSLKSLKNCVHLNHLSLRKNRIADLQELQHLKDAKSLTSLILAENPCSVAAGGSYRSSVLRILPQLKTLDEERVNYKERRVLSSEPGVIPPDQNSVDRATVPQPLPTRTCAKAQPLTSRGTFGGGRRDSGKDTVPSFMGTRAAVMPRVPVQHSRECLAPTERNPGNNRSTTPRDKAIASARVPVQHSRECLGLPEPKTGNSRSITPRDKAIASASACVDAITLRREQELKDDISQYYPVGPELQCRDRNGRLLMGALALVREMDVSTLEVLCRAIQDRVKLPT